MEDVLSRIVDYCNYQLAQKSCTPIGFQKIHQQVKDYLADGREDFQGGFTAIARIASSGFKHGSRNPQGYNAILQIAAEMRAKNEQTRKRPVRRAQEEPREEGFHGGGD